jgi:drug/metabolite transporter (DMT)-like permease
MTYAVVRFVAVSILFLVFSRSARRGARILFWPRNKSERQFRRDMMALGSAIGAGYLLQSVGLLTTTTSKSAFLTSTSVIWTPLFSWLLGRERMSWKLIIAVIITLAGIFLMTQPFRQQGIVIGDVLTIGCALAFGVYIILIDRATARAESLASSEHEAAMMVTSNQIVVASLIFIVFLFLFDTPRLHVTPYLIGSLIYTGLVATVLTAYLQARYQNHVTPTSAAIIYMLEPLVAMIIGMIFLHERIGIPGMLGGGLIILGVIIAQVKFETLWGSNQEATAPASDY